MESSDNMTSHNAQTPLNIDDEDSDSGSDASNSTAVYEHEAFESFQHKVLALGTELRLDFQGLERLKGGCHNRIIALTMHNLSSETGSEDTTKAILRIPRFDEPVSPGNEIAEHTIAHRAGIQATEDTENPYLWFREAINDNLPPESSHLEILDGVAILKLLARSSIPVPRILAFDPTRNNALGFPYSLYTRLPGVTLGDVWKDMPTDGKINIAGELATLLAGLNTIRFPQSGRLLHDHITTNVQSPLDHSKRSEVGHDVVVGGFGRGFAGFEERDKPTVLTTSSLYDLLRTHLDDKFQYAKFMHPEESEVEFAKLQAMLQDMKDMNWFDPDDGSAEYSIINHNDYDPRNIIVELREDADGSSSWHLSGIVDWDDAHCVPPVLTRRPPLWLFDFVDDDLIPDVVWKYYDMDHDMMPLEYYKETNTDHLTLEGAKIKERFEQVMVDKIYSPRHGARAMEIYQDDTYGRGRWLRRVWRFANEGMYDNSHDRRFRQVLKEWEEFKKTGQVSHRTVFGEEDDSDATNSTIAYDHEPFETFQNKVSTLGSDLDVVFDDIEHMRGGSFNRVVPVTLRNPPETASWIDGTRAIIRIPRVWDGDLNKIPADEHGRTCKCDAHPERQVVVSDEHESESGSTSSTTEEVIKNPPTLEGPIGTEVTDSSPKNPTSDKGSSSEENDDDGASDDSDISEISDVSNISSRRSLSKEPFQWEILDETVLYNLLEDAGIPAPRILAFDVGRHNVLKFPYSIQTRLPGVTWISVMRDMPLEFQLLLAEDLADVMARLQTVHFESSGRLQCNQKLDTPLRLSLDSSTREEIKEKLEIWGFPKEVGALMDSARTSPCQPVWNSLYDLLFYSVHDLLTRELQQVTSQGPSEQLVRMYLKLKDIIQDMDHIGWFSEADKRPSQSVLYHWDLEARNIMIERTGNDPSSPWRISGIIDWDNPHALPAVLTMKSPIWLWDTSDDAELPEEVQEYYDNDFDWMPLEYYEKENPAHLNADGMKVKQRFEEAIVKKLYSKQYGVDAHAKYLDDAYGRGRWLRRIWRFASEGIFSHPSHWRRMEQLDREWMEYKRANGIEYDHIEYAKTLRVYSSSVQYNTARNESRSEPTSNIQEANAESKIDTTAETNSSQDGKLHLVIPGHSVATSPADDTAGIPEQRLPRSKTFSTFLHSLKCAPS
ncbi:unnamed protein product [Aureobasidium uvarum]|uniref:Aminoglycoside phosphotransferase domain-containing protein n=1 Tax=Aureobasidium uvarum TaxID=2773716 RepID=A0A9N8KKI5_9PEZI|nr:unnamed protein product [Aureobasidium uvarum]